ncbi:MAG: hypothetical protein IIB00_06690 [candidate division Zixibacteria bacterium]|nr:hypothetical protein [candidate division Zixibacteria bacterium]
MRQSVRLSILAPILILAIGQLSVFVMANSAGPIDKTTGAPGETTCGDAICHGNLNVGSGSVTITAPASYTAGQTLTISVNLSNIGQSRWGFEATVLDGSNNPVGNMLVTDPTRTQISMDILTQREYIKHTLTGTDSATLHTAPGWSFDWKAPATLGGGPVTFYVAGNAANGNGFSTGDSIYTTSALVTENTASCCVTPGDADNGGDVNIGDAIFIVKYAFVEGSPKPPCCDQADADGGGDVNIGDAIYIVKFAFIEGSPAPLCPAAGPLVCL